MIKKKTIELWQKMSDVEKQTNHTNIALKRIRKYCGKKTKDIREEEKEKYKAYFEGEAGIFIIEKLARNIIERCQISDAIKLKKLRYNQDDIMIREEISIAEKIKLFPKESIGLMKNLMTEKQVFGLKIMM